MPSLPVYTVGGVYPRPRRPQPWCHADKNIVSGVVSLVAIVVGCASLRQPQWFWVEGGGCSTHSLGLHLFFHPGTFTAVEGGAYGPSTPHVTYHTLGQELKFCVTPEIVSLVRVLIGLVLLMLCCSLLQALLDVLGPPGKVLRCVRKNAVPGIASVLVCVVCVGVCYYITVLVAAQQEATRPDLGPTTTRVQVRLNLGFYLLIFAGGLSVTAVGCSWLRPSHIFGEGDTAPLVEEWGSLEDALSPHPGSSLAPYMPYLHDLEPPPPVEGHPPPPYTP